MRRYQIIALGFAGTAFASASLAQTAATNTKADIIRAMSEPSGAKAEPAADDEESDVISLGGMKQKGFSLGLSGAGKKPAATTTAAVSTRTAPASRSSAQRAVSTRPAAVQNVGRGGLPSYGNALDMRVSFDLNSANLTEQGKAEARVFAEAIQSPELTGKRFIVAGHTDSIGGRAPNIELSRRRAQSVVDFLVAQGADRSRLVPAGYGFDRPRAGTSAADAGNRRVEFARAN